MSDPVNFNELKPVHYAPVTAPPPRDRTLMAIVVLGLLALAGTIALLPSSEEKAEGLLAEGRYGDAIEMLVGVEDERSLNAYESYLLFKLYLLARQPDSAAMLLEVEPALQVDNVWALRQLSDLYRQDRNIVGEASTLRQLYDISPTDTDFARLRILYRLTGDASREASLLAQAIAAGRTDRAHLDRLAYLQTHGATGRAALWVSPSFPLPTSSPELVAFPATTSLD
jgi:hypothetical protein